MNDICVDLRQENMHVANDLPLMPEIPRGRYTSETLYQAEMQHVFRKSWLFVGHTCEYEQAGSYRLLELPIAPVIVVRGKDDKLRAFINSCKHRGASVVREKEGHAKSLSCPYHGWTYNLEGKLIGVTDEETFQSLDPKKLSLSELRCEQWGGFIFINFDREAPALLDWLGPIAERYGLFAAAPLRIMDRKTMTIECNWKLIEDAFRETYHVNYIHRKTISPVLEADRSTVHLYPHGHAVTAVPYDTSKLDASFVARQSSLKIIPGADTPEICGHLLGVEVFPNLVLPFQAYGFPSVQKWPDGIGRTRFEITWYGMDWDTPTRPAEWDERLIPAFDAIMAEDVAMLSAIQKAVEADVHASAPLSTQEIAVYQLHSEIDRLVGANNVPADLHVPDILDGKLPKSVVVKGATVSA